ncbi:MAG: kynureninase [Ignavibacteria bacterium]|nr:kynureninase [Ignavibacteria bacterium]
MFELKYLSENPNPLSGEYTHFKVNERILLTGHSHQAWPDCANEGYEEAWRDAGELIDDKWENAFRKADEFRGHLAALMNDKSDNFVLAQNTHDLILRFLSALDLKKRNKIITTDGEFHSARRQLDRLNGEWLNVVKVSKNPADTLSERIAGLIDDKTAAVIVSKVMYQDSAIIENLGITEDACIKHGAYLLIDAYHALNAIPFSIKNEKLHNSFIVGGGYKYLQLGEGNSFMRIPEGVVFRPAITGWFSEFAALSEKKNPGDVQYGSGHWAFAGATYDPVSHYRAVRVFKFFREQGLTPEVLREISLRQKNIIADEFDKCGFDTKTIKRYTDKPLTEYGGFIVFLTPHAGLISAELKKRNVYTDFRGNHLRFGPAPFMSDYMLRDAVDALRETVAGLVKQKTGK